MLDEQGFFVEYIFNCILQPWPDGLYLCFISDQGWNTDFITSMAYIDPVSFVILLTYQLLGTGWIFFGGEKVETFKMSCLTNRFNV